MIETEVVIVGGGPIGIEVAAALQELGVSYVLIEARQIGQTILDWPRDTKFLSSPERDAIAGVPIQTRHQDMLSGEEYLAYLRTVVDTLGLSVATYERAVDVRGSLGAFEVRTERPGGGETYRSERVVLATGDMSEPKLLGVPGEELPHVSHRFVEPHRYFRRRLLVVGGRNSAVEAALRCFRAGADVTISYRRRELDRKRVYSRYHLEIGILIEKGKVGFLPETEPVEIGRSEVVLRGADGTTSRRAADFVLLCTGFSADLSLFRAAGVSLSSEDLEPSFDALTMETDVPGLYVAGTAANGNRRSERLFIATCHVHVERIARSIAGRETTRAGNAPRFRYAIASEDIDTH